MSPIAREAWALNYFLGSGFRFTPRTDHAIALPLGRMALRLIARDLLRRKVTEVWVPALICDVAPAALQSEGVQVRFYPVGQNFSADLAWLEKANPASNSAILSVNYFGLMRPAQELGLWATRRGMLLIEDNAHGILSTPLPDSARADYRFESIGKALGLRYGTLLYFPTQSGPFILSQIAPARFRVELSTLFSALPPSLRNLLRKSRPPSTVSLPLSTLAPSRSLEPIPASRISAWLWSLAPKGAIARQRRLSYQRWWEQVTHHPELGAELGAKLGPLLNPALSLGESDVPWVFPLQVPATSRQSWINAIRAQAIEAFAWPDLPPEITPSHPAWRDHYDGIIALPSWWQVPKTEMRLALKSPLP